MRCYKCLKQVPDRSEECPYCGQILMPTLKKGKKKAGTAASQEPAPHPQEPPKKEEPSPPQKIEEPSPPAQQAAQAKEYQMGDVIADRYEVREVVARSGVGTLFKARDKKKKKVVALKMFSPTALDPQDGLRRFLKVMKTVMEMEHQHLVAIYDVTEDRGVPFYTMEYLEGLSLKKLLVVRTAEKKVFSLEEAEPIVLPICLALSFLHKNKIRYISLKPENIFLLPASLTLTGAGEASQLNPAEFISAQLSLGDPYYYLAPEFITSGGKAGPQADIYSLGVILYQMVTGVIPKGTYEPPSRMNKDLPPDLDGFLEKALDQDAGRRHDSAETFRRGFLLILGKEVPAEVPESLEAPAAEVVEEKAPEEEIERAPAAESVEEEASAAEIESAPEPKAVPEVVPEEAAAPPPAPQSPAIPEKPEEKGEPFVYTPEMKTALQKEAAPPLPLEPLPPLPPPVKVQHPPVDVPPRVAEIRIPRAEAVPRPEMKPRAEPAMPKRGAKTFVIAGSVLLVLALGVVGAYTLLQEKSRPPEPPRKTQARAPQPPRPAPEETKKVEEDKARAAEEARKKAEEARRVETEKKQQTKVAAAKKPEAPPPSRCPEGMIQVPAGDFIMGSPANDTMRDFSEKKNVKVYLADFCIDVYEYPDRKGAPPLKNVSWSESRSQCESRGKRLCTEEEWEKACKGSKNLRFPYGNEWIADKCDTQDSTGGKRSSAASGRFAGCRSDYGSYDMSGNLREWTSSRFSATLEDKVIKGGSWGSPDWASRCAYRYNALPQTKDEETGFRCCK